MGAGRPRPPRSELPLLHLYRDRIGRAQLIAQHLGLLPRDGAPARLSDVQLSDLTVTSHGESNLLVRTPDNTPEARNRRVEVTIR